MGALSTIPPPPPGFSLDAPPPDVEDNPLRVQIPPVAPGQPDRVQLASRNNNPGNVEFVGQPGAESSGRFAKFPTPEAGLADVHRIIGEHQSDTLEKYLTTYAPPSENNTAAYIANAAKALGVSPDTPVSKIDRQKLAAFQIQQESGSSIVPPPPDGFKLDASPSSPSASRSAIPPPPDGFKIDSPPAGKPPASNTPAPSIVERAKALIDQGKKIASDLGTAATSPIAGLPPKFAQPGHPIFDAWTESARGLVKEASGMLENVPGGQYARDLLDQGIKLGGNALASAVDFLATPLGVATAPLAAEKGLAGAATRATFSATQAPEAGRRIVQAVKSPTPENVAGAAVSTVGAALPMVPELAAGTGKVVDAGTQAAGALERHNAEAARLVEQERQQGLGVQTGQEAIGADQMPIKVGDRTLIVRAAGGDPNSGRPFYQVADEQGKTVFGGFGQQVQEYLRQQGAAPTYAAPPVADSDLTIGTKDYRVREAKPGQLQVVDTETGKVAFSGNQRQLAQFVIDNHAAPGLGVPQKAPGTAREFGLEVGVRPGETLRPEETAPTSAPLAAPREPKVTVPEEGTPENVERAQDARERVTRTLGMDRPFKDLSNSERLVVDHFVSEGYGFAVQPGETEPEQGIIRTPAGSAVSGESPTGDKINIPGNIPAPPEGFTLDAKVPPPREGFAIDEQQTIHAGPQLVESPSSTIQKTAQGTPSSEEKAALLKREPSVPLAQGEPTVISVPGEKTTYPAHYAVMEAADLQASHNPQNFELNPAYQHQNDRDYTSTENAARVVNAAQDFRPEFVLTKSPTAELGTTIVDTNGNALGGNNRAMALQRVYQSGDQEKAQEYRDELVKNAQQFGIKPAELDRFKEPVLVRQVTQPLAGKAAANAITDFNKSSAATLNPGEQAVADGRRLSVAAVKIITGSLDELGDEGTLSQALRGDNGQEILTRLVKDGVLTEQEKNGYLDERGQLTPEVKNRIAQALVGRMFKTPKEYQQTPPELRAKAERIAPQVLRVEGRKGWELTQPVKEALSLLTDMRTRRAGTVDDLLAQAHTEGGKPVEYSPAAIQIAKKLQEAPLSAARAFRMYATDESMSRKGAQTTLYQPPTQREAFENAFGAQSRTAKPAAKKKGAKEAPASAEVHEYSSTQVDLPAAIAAKVKAAGKKIPAAELDEEGREAQPHITVLYGLHAADPAEAAALLKETGPIEAKLGKISMFAGKDGGADVLKIDVESPDLAKMNAKLRGSVDYTNSYPKYVPHVTLAYVKPGEGKKYVGQSVPGVTGETIPFDSVTFSSKNGTMTPMPLTEHFISPSVDHGAINARDRLYHTTSIENATQAIEQGLLPEKGVEGKFVSLSREPRVWGREKPILIEIDRSGIRSAPVHEDFAGVDKFAEDRAAGPEFDEMEERTTQAVPAKVIRRIWISSNALAKATPAETSALAKLKSAAEAAGVPVRSATSNEIRLGRVHVSEQRARSGLGPKLERPAFESGTEWKREVEDARWTTKTGPLGTTFYVNEEAAAVIRTAAYEDKRFKLGEFLGLHMDSSAAHALVDAMHKLAEETVESAPEIADRVASLAHHLDVAVSDKHGLVLVKVRETPEARLADWMPAAGASRGRTVATLRHERIHAAQSEFGNRSANGGPSPMAPAHLGSYDAAQIVKQFPDLRARLLVKGYDYAALKDSRVAVTEAAAHIGASQGIGWTIDKDVDFLDAYFRALEAAEPSKTAAGILNRMTATVRGAYAREVEVRRAGKPPETGRPGHLLEQEQDRLEEPPRRIASYEAQAGRPQLELPRTETLNPAVAEHLAIGSTRVNPDGSVQELREVPLDQVTPLTKRPEAIPESVWEARGGQNVIYPEAVERYAKGPAQVAPELIEPEAGQYEIWDGHHRVEAARRRGESTIKAWLPPVHVSYSTEERRDELGSLFGPEAEAQIDAEHERDREQLTGAQLTAQLRAPVSREEQLKRLRRSKAKPQTNLFEAPEEQQQKGFFDDTSGSAKISALTLGLDKFVEQDIAPTLAEASRTIAQASDDVLKILLPTARGGEKTKVAALILRNDIAELQRHTDRAEAALATARLFFQKMGDAKGREFILKYFGDENAPLPKTGDKDLDGIAQVLRNLLDGRRDEVQALGKGKLAKFYTNYFPRVWKDWRSAEGVFAGFYGRRPLEGGKGFLKQRKHVTIQDAIDAGLEPVSWNPIDLVLLKVREMDRYVMAHTVLQHWRESGLLQYIDARSGKAPAGWMKVVDPIGTVYGPSIQQISEFPNDQLYRGLQEVADALGVQHERGFKPLARGTAVGLAHQGGKVETMHGSAEQVLAHEIGHQIDWLAGSGNRFVVNYPSVESVARIREARRVLGSPGSSAEARKAANKTLRDMKPDIQKRKKFAAELRALADLRHGGERTAYTHKREEKMALLSEMWAGARELFQKTAPTVFREWKQFLAETPKLKALHDLEAGTDVARIEQPYDVGGLVIRGHWWAPEGAARILNNYLSPSLRTTSGAYKAVLGANNVLNQFQLGLSAFHLGFTSADAAVSKAALGFEALMRGRPLAAAKAFVSVPTAPFTTMIQGNKLLREWYKPGSEGAWIAQLVDGLVAAGGRARMDAIYGTAIADRMRHAFRNGNVWGGLIRAPFAAVEAISNVMMKEIVPRQKLGVFADMARFELERLGPDATFEQTRAALAQAWDSVENRMGQMTYDNLFWNRTMKDIAMLGVRSVGWNLGTIREIGGGAVDLVKIPIQIAGGKPPGEVNLKRISYLMGLVTVSAIMGAIYQYLRTGKGPEEAKDLFFPKTGQLDAAGRPDRAALPTYVKDVYHYRTEPGKTLANKVAPIWSVFGEMIRNEDFYGTEIRGADDPLVEQMKQLAEYAGHAAEPFGIRNFERDREMQNPPIDQAQRFIGITPAPSAIEKTKAERLASELSREHIPAGSRTHGEAARRDAESTIARLARAGKDYSTQARDYVQSGVLTAKDAHAAAIRSQASPLLKTSRSLPLEDLLDVWKVATPEERTELRPLLARHLKTLKDLPIAQREQLTPRLTSALEQ